MKTAWRIIAILLILPGAVLCTSCTGGFPTATSPDGAVPADEAAMTGVEQAYLEFVINHLQTVRDDFGTLSVLFSDPDMEDEHWRASVTVLLNRTELAGASIATLDPTERLRPVQDASASALGHAAAFVKLLRDMLAAGETTLTDEATQELVRTSEAFDEVDRLLSEFLQAHPAPEELTAGPVSGS